MHVHSPILLEISLMIPYEMSITITTNTIFAPPFFIFSKHFVKLSMRSLVGNGSPPLTSFTPAFKPSCSRAVLNSLT